MAKNPEQALANDQLERRAAFPDGQQEAEALGLPTCKGLNLTNNHVSWEDPSPGEP